MTRFYGFSKRNTGVMPECAKTHLVSIVYTDGLKLRLADLDDPDYWSLVGDKTDIRAYIPTDIPL